MSKKSLNVAAGIIGAAVVAVATVVAIADQREQKRANAVADRNGVKIRKPSSKYEQFAKRPLDAVLSIGATVALSPVLGTIALLVKKKLGSPVFFSQERPGRIDPATGKETLFKLYKFRTMTNERDADGNLFPDEVRLTKFGAWLRSTSLEGNDIIGQTTASLVNKGFREVSPIHFFTGRDLFSKKTDLFDIEGGMNLLAVNQGQEAFRAA